MKPTISKRLYAHVYWMRGTYNPAHSQDSVAAKIWELLRRHPSFRAFASEICEIRDRKRPKKSDIQVFLNTLDKENPLIGFVCRWFFRPAQWDFDARGFGLREDVDDWFSAQMDPTTEAMIPSGSTLSHLVLCEKAKHLYAGPLHPAGGTFGLDTDWPSTPESFRYLFARICDPLCIPNHRRFKMPMLMQGEFQLSSRQSRSDSCVELSSLSEDDAEGLATILKYHHIFVVPRFPFTKSDKAKLVREFTQWLDEALNKQIIHGTATKFFLGSGNEWDAFISCYPHVDYFERTDGKLQIDSFHRTGLNQAVKEFAVDARHRRNEAKTGEWSSHARRYFEKLEKTMLALFPRADWGHVLESYYGVTDRRSQAFFAQLFNEKTRDKLLRLEGKLSKAKAQTSKSSLFSCIVKRYFYRRLRLSTDGV